MTETTTEKKTTRTRTPKKNSRQEFLDRVINDFTYTSDQSNEQRETWKWIRLQFEGTESRIRNTLEMSPIEERLIHTDAYDAFKKSLRIAERFCNAAVARDWKANSAFDFSETELIEYPGERPDVHAPEKIKLCHEATAQLFQLATLMARYLPEGRALSCAATELEVTRGWLLDTVNFNVK